mmetsp:Transcript_17250/g.65810  ORF Transcript_17250/g.65810 Transcript_17250/m.65810 type:complete len:267 (-) Transcript_17250:291-1091(-)
MPSSLLHQAALNKNAQPSLLQTISYLLLRLLPREAKQKLRLQRRCSLLTRVLVCSMESPQSSPAPGRVGLSPLSYPRRSSRRLSLSLAEHVRSEAISTLCKSSCVFLRAPPWLSFEAPPFRLRDWCTISRFVSSIVRKLPAKLQKNNLGSSGLMCAEAAFERLYCVQGAVDAAVLRSRRSGPACIAFKKLYCLQDAASRSVLRSRKPPGWSDRAQQVFILPSLAQASEQGSCSVSRPITGIQLCGVLLRTGTTTALVLVWGGAGGR